MPSCGPMGCDEVERERCCTTSAASRVPRRILGPVSLGAALLFSGCRNSPAPSVPAAATGRSNGVPSELRDFHRGGQFFFEPNLRSFFEYDEGGRFVEIESVRIRPSATVSDRFEVPGGVVGACALGPRELLVVWSDAPGSTTVEHWTVDGMDAGSGPRSHEVSKRVLLRDQPWPTLRDLAADPAGTFLIAILHESNEVARLDLATGAVDVLLTTADHGNLSCYSVCGYDEHETRGPCFLVQSDAAPADHARFWEWFVPRADPTTLSHDVCLVLWDAEVDGVPDIVETCTAKQCSERGYDSDPSPWWSLRRPFRGS